MIDYNLDPVILGKLKAFFDAYQELKNALNAVSLDVYGGQKSVHLTPEKFMQLFRNFEITDRDCNKYPHKFSTKVNDIVFFAIGDVKEVSMNLVMEEVV